MVKIFDVDFAKQKISKEEVLNLLESKRPKRTISIQIPRIPSDVEKKVEDNQNKTN